MRSGSAAVALRDGATDVGRNMPGAAGRPGLPLRPDCRSQPGTLELRDQQSEGAIEDLGDFARGQLVAQQFLGTAQLVVRALADRDVQRVAPWSQWGDSRAGLTERILSGRNLGARIRRTFDWPRGQPRVDSLGCVLRRLRANSSRVGMTMA